jgi:hypothetical protein
MPISYLSDPDLMDKTILNPEWLKNRKKEELVEIVIDLTTEIANKMTSQMASVPTQLQKLEFVPVKVQSVDSFQRLPVKAETALLEDTKKVILVVPESNQKPIGIEIVRSIVLGRGKDADNIDLDLSDYDAGGLGVSRRHAILQTIANVLYVADTGSTNGTYLNGKRLKMGEPKRVDNDAIISLGGFHFKVIIIEDDEEK